MKYFLIGVINFYSFMAVASAVEEGAAEGAIKTSSNKVTGQQQINDSGENVSLLDEVIEGKQDSPFHIPDSLEQEQRLSRGQRMLLIPLEQIRVGKSIIEGDIEEYKEAIKELRDGLGFSLFEILELKTSSKNNILDLMIQAEKNREYFAREMQYFIISVAVLNENSVFHLLFNIQSRLRVAIEANNHIAVEYLSGIQQLIIKFKEDHIAVQEKMLRLLEKSKHNTSLLSSGIYTIVGGLLAVVGYKTFSSSFKIMDIASPITSLVIENSDRAALGAAAIATGAVGVIRGVQVCKRAFSKARNLKKERQRLQGERSNISNM